MVSLSPLVRNFPKPRDVSGFSDLDLCLYRLRERIYRTAVFCNGFSSRSILTITVPCRSSGFYPPRCYQASPALSPQYFLRICHPLHPAPLRDLLRGLVLWRHSSLQRQCRRASPGKTHRLPVSRPTSQRFGSPDIRARLVTSARPPCRCHIVGSLFATYTGSASCFLQTSHFWIMPLPCWRGPSVR